MKIKLTRTRNKIFGDWFATWGYMAKFQFVRTINIVNFLRGYL